MYVTNIPVRMKNVHIYICKLYWFQKRLFSVEFLNFLGHKFLSFPCGPVVKKAPAGDLGSISRLDKSGEENGNRLQYSCLVSSLATQTVKHLPTVRETWVPSLNQKDLLEKKMAPHSNTLAWKIPWTEEPGGLQSMELQRVGHDWATSLSSYMDRGAGQTTVHGSQKSQTWLSD